MLSSLAEIYDRVLGHSNREEPRQSLQAEKLHQGPQGKESCQSPQAEELCQSPWEEELFQEPLVIFEERSVAKEEGLPRSDQNEDIILKKVIDQANARATNSDI